MRLFIAEKPSVAKALFIALGGDPYTQKINGYYQNGNDVVTNALGHLLRLADPIDYDEEKYKFWDLKNLPIKTFYPPKLIPIDATLSQFNIVKSLILKADEVVSAVDVDDEGTLIFNELIEYVGFNKPIKKVLITDLNIEPIKKALNNLRDNDEFTFSYHSALARSIGDQIFGYNMTELYTLSARNVGYIGKFNLGRVSSVILGLVNARTLANQNHIKSYFYEINANFKIDGNIFASKYIPNELNDDLNEKGMLISEERAIEIKNNKNNKFFVKSLDVKNEKKAAPSPYNLSSMQMLCAKKWGYSAKDTTAILQGLYDNLYLTYPRTDCRALPLTFHSNAKTIIENAIIFDNDYTQYCSTANTAIISKSFDDEKVTAHHAICVTEKFPDKNILNEKELNIYNAVLKNYIGLFQDDSIREKTKAIISNNELEFTATQTIVLKKGWEDNLNLDDDNSNEIKLNSLPINSEIEELEIDYLKKETTPEKYFVTSTLLSAMTKAAKFIKDPDLRKILENKDKNNKAENGSIGTEATRGELLEKAMENKDLFILEKVSGYKELVWKTTVQGQELANALPNEIIMPDTSAIWEEKRELIRKGEYSVEDFISYIDNYIAERVEHVKTHGIEISRNTIPCPKCNRGLIRGRSSATAVQKPRYYWRCDGYPDCTEIFPCNGGKPQLEKKPVVISSIHNCKTCNSGLIKRRSKGKSFWACSSSECKTTYSDRGNVPFYK